MLKNYNKENIDFVNSCEDACKEQFDIIEKTALLNQAKVLEAFADNRVESRHFYPSTGYGYGDSGRDTLDRLFADILGKEDAVVRPQIVSGTHALTITLFGLLRPGKTLLYITGRPYDTLQPVIGIKPSQGSLTEWGVNYKEIDIIGKTELNDEEKEAIKSADVIALQRSSGYGWRVALSVAEIHRLISLVKTINSTAVIMTDNCYGELTEETEPEADVLAGSLIKNLGGGLAPTGGYIAGKKELIEKISYSLTSPGIGREVGSFIGGYTQFYQGLFLAPHVVAQALKGAVLCARVFESKGYGVMPSSSHRRSDIIQSIVFNNSEELIRFCQAVQAVSPVDAHVVPEPSDMPGYTEQVIMAAGTFLQGASIELTADAPIKPPYIVYWQGGLSYEHCKLALIKALDKIFGA